MRRSKGLASGSRARSLDAVGETWRRASPVAWRQAGHVTTSRQQQTARSFLAANAILMTTLQDSALSATPGPRRFTRAAASLSGFRIEVIKERGGWGGGVHGSVKVLTPILYSLFFGKCFTVVFRTYVLYHINTSL